MRSSHPMFRRGNLSQKPLTQELETHHTSFVRFSASGRESDRPLKWISQRASCTGRSCLNLLHVANIVPSFLVLSRSKSRLSYCPQNYFVQLPFVCNCPALLHRSCRIDTPHCRKSSTPNAARDLPWEDFCSTSALHFTRSPLLCIASHVFHCGISCNG